MLGGDHLLDGPSATTVGLFGNPLFPALIAVIRLYSNGGAVTAGSILTRLDSGASWHSVDDYITSGFRGRLSNYAENCTSVREVHGYRLLLIERWTAV